MSLAIAIIALPLNTTVTIQFYDNMIYITPYQVIFWYISSYIKEDK